MDAVHPNPKKGNELSDVAGKGMQAQVTAKQKSLLQYVSAICLGLLGLEKGAQRKKENGFIISSDGAPQDREAGSRDADVALRRIGEERAERRAQGTVAEDAKYPVCTASSSIVLLLCLFVVGLFCAVDC